MGNFAGRSCDPDSDPGTIEHVLPENPGGGWVESFPPQLWESAVYRLGNLTLLETAANRRAGNAEYSAKRQEYEKSTYAVTREITEIGVEEWTPAILDERQRRLASRAVRIWHADVS